MTLRSEMYRALRAVQRAWDSDSEDALDEMEGAIYEHVIPAIERYQREKAATEVPS